MANRLDNDLRPLSASPLNHGKHTHWWTHTALCSYTLTTLGDLSSGIYPTSCPWSVVIGFTYDQLAIWRRERRNSTITSPKNCPSVPYRRVSFILILSEYHRDSGFVLPSLGKYGVSAVVLLIFSLLGLGWSFSVLVDLSWRTYATNTVFCYEKLHLALCALANCSSWNNLIVRRAEDPESYS